MLGGRRAFPRPQHQVGLLDEVDADPGVAVEAVVQQLDHRPHHLVRLGALRRPCPRSRPAPPVRRRRSQLQLPLEAGDRLPHAPLDRHRPAPVQVDGNRRLGGGAPAARRWTRCSASNSQPMLVVPIRRTRTNTSSWSSKRAGAWYSTCCARITNSGSAGSRVEHAEVGAGTRPGRGRSRACSGRSRRCPGRRSRRSRRGCGRRTGRAGVRSVDRHQPWISSSTSSRRCSICCWDSASRFSRSSGSVLEGRTLKCQSSNSNEMPSRCETRTAEPA